MRFISLIVEQKIDFNKSDMGIAPLLTLKLILLQIRLTLKKKPTHYSCRNPKKENELKSVRSKYTGTNDFESKLKLKEEDKLLRNEISKLLISDG